uniref:Ion transport domain-containing protein n=1 Tax=Alexandrium catenella TaxID=2925 RepID=A0A7S1SHH2_ALECA|mmetsp:Transcript_98853/g.262494  ORF Transcript_98853/g.262494 Transcript_98853/m.262494 type:complete len:210 (+) Transcript_98853:126-755(+)
MASAPNAAQALAEYEQIYQPKVFNVKGSRWTNWGYVLIGCSTVIMAMQAAGLGPAEIWKRADDVTTVLFTFELLFRIYELEYEFFVGEERNWNFFDTLVVAISIASMAISAWAAQDASGKGGNSLAMNKMKVLRALRLLRLFRIFRALKSVEKVNQCVETLLTGLVKVFVGFVTVVALSALLLTMGVAAFAGGKAWLREHALPTMPQID